MEKVSKNTIDVENMLTEKRVEQLLRLNVNVNTQTERPYSSFKDLMWWVEKEFGSFIYRGAKGEIIPVINNSIGIEGAFLQYCDLNEIKIEPLLLDSISSWNSQSDTESFMVQGVFLIKTKEFSLIHCAMFHKGNQFEDEISYFVLVNKKDYMKYVNFRNDFVNWETKRANDVLEVRVIGGEDYIYSQTNKWSDLYLPASLKREIKVSIESFLTAKSKYEKNNLPWKRGVLLYGPQGNGKTTLIHTLISEYDLKPVTVSDIDDNILSEAFTYAEDNSPSLFFIEDIDGVFKDGMVSPRRFLNMIDGLKAIDGVILVLTTNFPKKLPRNLVDRRSRIDRLWEIPFPDKDMSFKFLRKWFKPSFVKNDPLTTVVETCIENEFSYADLKELYISTMFSAMSRGKEIPNLEDLHNALNLILNEKKNVNEGFEVSSGKKSKKFGFSASKR